MANYIVQLSPSPKKNNFMTIMDGFFILKVSISGHMPPDHEIEHA